MTAHAELRCIYRCSKCGKKETDQPDKKMKHCGAIMSVVCIVPEVWGHHECC